VLTPAGQRVDGEHRVAQVADLSSSGRNRVI
jgi:hypothetical protein